MTEGSKLDPAEELEKLRAASRELAKDRKAVEAQLADFGAQVAEKAAEIRKLERERDKLEGKDVGPEEPDPTPGPKKKAEPEKAEAAKEESTFSGVKKGFLQGDKKEERPIIDPELPDWILKGAYRKQGLEPPKWLQGKATDALRDAKTQNMRPPGEDEEEFKREFNDEGEGKYQQIMRSITAEQRLIWEIQNPIRWSPKLDQRRYREYYDLGRHEEAKLMLEAVGPPTEQEKERRPLMWMNRNPEINPSWVEPTMADTSILIEACKVGFVSIARQLLKAKADPHHVGKNNASALTTACMYRQFFCARMLLEHDANPNETSDKDGRTQLMLTAMMPEKRHDKDPPNPMVGMLLEFDADVDATDNLGRTALMLATERDRRAAVKELLKQKADPELRDLEGKSALDLAEKDGFQELTDELRYACETAAERRQAAVQ